MWHLKTKQVNKHNITKLTEKRMVVARGEGRWGWAKCVKGVMRYNLPVTK